MVAEEKKSERHGLQALLHYVERVAAVFSDVKVKCTGDVLQKNPVDVLRMETLKCSTVPYSKHKNTISDFLVRE